MDVTLRDVLPPDYALHWYRIRRVLGQGGFGITYLAHDANLDHDVAIKEYLPVEFAVRANNYTVAPRSAARDSDFKWGLERFISEARTLSKFDHRSIVRVHSVFEHNGTAYMVMRYERGESLDALMERRKTLEEEALRRVLLPILDGLRQVHRSGFIHRDIKPANIYVREDGSSVLLDFGAAREAVGRSKSVTILVAPGYAPFEQYHAQSETQGPWTDIYSLGATLYRGISSVAPIDAIERSRGILGSTRDVLVPASLIGKGRYSEHFLRAVDHALAFDERARPQSIDAWLEELEGGTDAEAPAEAAAVETPSAPRVPERAQADAFSTGRPLESGGDQTTKRPMQFGWRWAAGVLVGVSLGLALSVLLFDRDEGAEAPASEGERSQSGIEDFEARKQALLKELETSEARVATVDAEATRTETELVEVASKVVAARSELENARAELASAEGEAQTARVELGRLTAEADEARRAVATLEEQSVVQRTELDAGEAELRRLEESRAVLAADLDQKAAGVERSAAALVEDRRARDALLSEIEALEKRRAALEVEQARPASTSRAPSVTESPGASPAAARSSAMHEDLAKAMSAIEAGDFRLALQELKPLAERCVTDAQIRLAELYLQGLGASKPDPFKSYLWYRAAQPRAGDTVAAGLAAAANELQSAQVTQAEKLAGRVIATCP